MALLKVTLHVSDEGQKEALSNFLLEIGAEGVSETVDKGISQGLAAFFAEGERDSADPQIQLYLTELAKLFPGTPAIKVEWEPVYEEDWAEKYKEFYKAQKLTHRFFLKPAWDKETKVPSDMWPIILDPGQAFGTGLHATTKLSIHLLEDAAFFYPSVKHIRVMDVGTGTGILAMAAKHLGFGHISAIDNDPPSVEVARENLAMNGCASVELSGKPFAEFKEPFDVIVSNILLETHLLLAKEYGRLVVPGGQLILSGLLGGQRAYLEEAILPQGFVPLVSYHLQEWAAFSYVRRNVRS